MPSFDKGLELDSNVSVITICIITKTPKTYAKSKAGPSPALMRSLVPNIWDMLSSVPSLAVASPTTNTAFNTARTGPTCIFLCAAARRCLSQLNLTPNGGLGAVKGGEPTEYRPGWGPSAVRKRRSRRWHVSRIPPSATPPPLSRDFTWK